MPAEPIDSRRPRWVTLADLLFERARRSLQTRSVARELGIPCQQPVTVQVRSFDDEAAALARTNIFFCALYFNQDHVKVLRASWQQIVIEQGIPGKEYFNNVLSGLLTYAAKYHGDGYRLINTKTLTSEHFSFFYQLGEAYLRAEPFPAKVITTAERLLSVGLDRPTFLQPFMADCQLADLLTLLSVVPDDRVITEWLIDPAKTDLLLTLCRWGHLLKETQKALKQANVRALIPIVNEVVQLGNTFTLDQSEEVGQQTFSLKELFQDYILAMGETALPVLLDLAVEINSRTARLGTQQPVFPYHFVKGLIAQIAKAGLIDLYVENYRYKATSKVLILKETLAENCNFIMGALDSLPPTWRQLLARLGALLGLRTKTAAILSLRSILFQSIIYARQIENLILYFAEQSTDPTFYSCSIPEQIRLFKPPDKIVKAIMQRVLDEEYAFQHPTASAVCHNIRQLVQEAKRPPKLTLYLALKLWQISDLVSRELDAEAAALIENLKRYTKWLV
jgi:hypothetical protein